jgi:hypothetical protein
VGCGDDLRWTAVGLIEWVLLWVCGFFYGGLRWWVCICSGFCFFLFYVAPNIVKYFRDYFPKCKQTLKKQSFSLKIIFIYKHFTAENVLRRNKRSLSVII